ncbi:hypothetical protein ABFX02_08G081700 [Erythranthe guttata]
MERGESSGSNSSGDDVWAKLVSVDSSYSDIELRLTELTICSEMKSSSSEKREWCKITREIDRNSALMQNTSGNSIIVDGIAVKEGDTTSVICGSEIILGPESDGFRRYTFKVMPTKEICKIILDPEIAKCSICLSVWHDVVTVSPCLHNFCNGCFSMWLKKCREKRSIVLCPQCRGIVQFVSRNPFLHSIEEDILKSDSSLRRTDEEIAHLDSHSSIKLPDSSSYSGGAGTSSLYQGPASPPVFESLSEEMCYLRHTLDQQRQYIGNMVLLVRRVASHANVDISDIPPFQPQPFPGFQDDDEDDDEDDDNDDDEDDDEDDDLDDDEDDDEDGDLDQDTDEDEVDDDLDRDTDVDEVW